MRLNSSLTILKMSFFWRSPKIYPEEPKFSGGFRVSSEVPKGKNVKLSKLGQVIYSWIVTFILYWIIIKKGSRSKNQFGGFGGPQVGLQIWKIEKVDEKFKLHTKLNYTCWFKIMIKEKIENTRLVIQDLH